MTFQGIVTTNLPAVMDPVASSFRLRSDQTVQPDDDRLYIRDRFKTKDDIGSENGSSGLPSGVSSGDEREPEMDTMRMIVLEMDDRMEQRVSMLKREVKQMALEIKMKDREIGMLKVSHLARERGYEEELASLRHLIKRLREFQQRKKNRGWFAGCY